MAEPAPAPHDDWAWANPQLRLELRASPAAVLRDRGINVPDDLPANILHEFVRVAHLLWVDGEIRPLDKFAIDPSDEGLLFGRGVWESTRTVGGTPWLWDLHLDRIRRTAEVLHISLAPERLPQAQQVAEYVRALTGQDVLVRLNVSAGRPGKPGVVWMSAAPIPQAPAALRLRTSKNPVEKGQAYLMLKTFQYATRLRIGQQAAQGGFDTALVLDSDGNLQEASHANLFVRLPEGWATPAADGGLLPGTVRQHVLQQGPLPVREQVIPASRIPEIREAFATNSNVGAVPVVQIDQHTFPVGTDTLNVLRWILPPPQGVQYRIAERGISPR